jgi:hypothetical protein
MVFIHAASILEFVVQVSISKYIHLVLPSQGHLSKGKKLNLGLYDLLL